MAQESLTQRIQRSLPPEQGPRITAAETDEAVILSGTVPSDEERIAAERAAAAFAPGKRITNLLDVERTLPADRAEGWDDQQRSLTPEFADQPLITDPVRAEDAGVEEDEPGWQTDSDSPYYPPSDPVIAPDEEGNLSVLGGFEAGSMEDMRVARSAEDSAPGDEALADAVTRELLTDALTTDLRLDVTVDEGIVHLRGSVPTLEDAENAEEVASRIPGVREVLEELDVSQL
jgi:osmotically-inducible protein OsmY